MGTDIHAFIEMGWSKKKEAFAEKESIYAFNFGELLISRDYDLFNALADGRIRFYIPHRSQYYEGLRKRTRRWTHSLIILV